MIFKVYTSKEGRPDELIDEIDAREFEVIRFCYANWTAPDASESRNLPLWQRRPPFEVQRPDGSWLPWDDQFENESDEEDEGLILVEGQKVTLHESVSCQRCHSHRVAHLSAKSSDMAFFSLGDKEKDGYLPDDVGIGGGDYVELSYCLDCGQIQGRFPLPPSDFETGDD